jgi:hypothetical protein
MRLVVKRNMNRHKDVISKNLLSLPTIAADVCGNKARGPSAAQFPSQGIVPDCHLANHTILIANGVAETPVSAAPIRQSGGPLFGIVLDFRDFTERKQMVPTLQSLAQFPSQNTVPVLRIGGSRQMLYPNQALLGKQYLPRVNYTCGVLIAEIPAAGLP